MGRGLGVIQLEEQQTISDMKWKVEKQEGALVESEGQHRKRQMEERFEKTP